MLVWLTNTAGLRGEEKTYTGVEYWHPAGVSLCFDGHVPAGEGPFPAAILVHGGAWVTGDRKRSVAPLFSVLDSANFAWFSISYRLANALDPKGLPTLALSSSSIAFAQDDVRAAVAFIRAHAAEYDVDPERIFLIGESAGAQLASIAALKPDENSRVRGVVAFYSPSDLVSIVQKSPMIPDNIRRAIQGTALETLLLARLRELSPITYVGANAPPFLMIHGTADPFVPFSQSTAFCDAMHQAGAKCDVYKVEGGGHGLRWWEPSESMMSYKAEMVRWLKNLAARPVSRR